MSSIKAPDLINILGTHTAMDCSRLQSLHEVRIRHAQLEHAVQNEMGPRMSNTSPLVAPALNKLLRRTQKEDKQRA